MNLVIDIGNTILKTAVFDDGVMIDHKILTYNTISEFSNILSKYEIERIGISNVRKIPEDLMLILNSIEKSIYVWDELKIPLEIEYSTPETLGHDRICNATAAKHLYPNENTLVIDMGTCNKYDFVTAQGKFIGGSIAPGFEMRFKAMNNYTDQLPLVEVSFCDDFIGDSTVNSMKSGAYFGILGEIEFFIKQYKARFNDIKVILTGGFSTYFDKEVKNHIFADSYLTLKGLNIILNFQEEK